MNTDQIKKIVSLLEEFDLTELEIEEKSLKLRVSRRQDNITALPMPQAIHNIPLSAPAEVGITVDASQNNKNGAPAAEDESLNIIKSPMVGTFYQSSSPESDPFVKAGDSVDTNSVVCIIEAMKVMNEIHAETKGKIAEVLVSDGDSVEFGQPLFKVKP